MKSFNGNVALALAFVQVVLTIYIRTVCASYIPLVMAGGHLMAIAFMLDSQEDGAILQWATRLTLVVGGTCFIVYSLDECGFQEYGVGVARIVIELVLVVFEANVIAMQWIAFARQNRAEPPPADVEMSTKAD
jgi:hypothetical protein